MLLYSGASKFGPHGIFCIELFAKIGIGQWFRYFTGSLEIICAVLRLIPRTSGIAAAFLACTMAGAVLTHLFILGDSYAAMFLGFPLSILIRKGKMSAFGTLQAPATISRRQSKN